MYDNASLEKPEVLIQQLEAGKAYIATVTALNKKVTFLPLLLLFIFTIIITIILSIIIAIHFLIIITIIITIHLPNIITLHRARVSRCIRWLKHCSSLNFNSSRKRLRSKFIIFLFVLRSKLIIFIFVPILT